MNVAIATSSPRERFHPRVEANFMVKVVMKGRTVVAKAKDLSMAGLFLMVNPNVQADRFMITVPLPDDREVHTGARVARRQDEGIALEFDPLDWDDMFALARYLHPRLR